MAYERGEDPIMIHEAITKEFLKMNTMVEELYRRAQGGAKTLVKAKEEGGVEEPPSFTLIIINIIFF
jgi:hypothetical protein